MRRQRLSHKAASVADRILRWNQSQFNINIAATDGKELRLSNHVEEAADGFVDALQDLGGGLDLHPVVLQFH